MRGDRRSGAWHQFVEGLEITIGAKRQIGNLRFAELRIDIGAIGLQGCDGGVHGHALIHLPHLELHIHAPHDVGFQLYVLLYNCAERRRRNRNPVRTSLQIVDRVSSAIVGDGLLGDTGGNIQRLDLRSRQVRAGGIGDMPGQRAVKNLRPNRRGEYKQHQSEDGDFHLDLLN